MRTTLTFADGVANAAESLRRERRLALSEAVNELVRRGLTLPWQTLDAFLRLAMHPMGLRRAPDS